jgi:hypothetical protein
LQNKDEEKATGGDDETLKDEIAPDATLLQEETKGREERDQPEMEES